jgi:hypothetical protein
MGWTFYDSSGKTLQSLGTISNDDWSGTDLAVANGGTGASTLTDGGILLGSGTSAVTAMAVLADGAIVVGDGTTDPVPLSAFSSSTGTLNVASGGTGAASLTDGGVLLGSSTSAITAMSVLADGEFIVGNGSTDPVAESGSVVRTSLGLTIGTHVQAYDADLAAIAGLANSDSNLIVGNGSTWVAESGTTLRTSLGLGTGATPTFTGLTLSADIDLQGANIDNGGVVFLKEQADADSDVAGSGQIWVDTITPNALYFTDDAGTDFNLSGSVIKYVFYRIVAAATDVATATTVGGDFEFPFTGTITEVGTFNDTAGITGTQVVDINIGGTTIMSTHKCDTDTTEKTTRTGAQLPVLTTTAITEANILTFDIDAIHSGTAAKGLTVRLEVRVT